MKRVGFLSTANIVLSHCSVCGIEAVDFELEVDSVYGQH